MTCLVLPVSNADSERTCSIVKKIQTEFRSELSVDTINSLLTTKQNQNVTCVDYAPTENQRWLKVPLWLLTESTLAL